MPAPTPFTGFSPSRFRLIPTANTQSGGRSPFDGTEQTLALPGARWAAEIGFEGLDSSEGRPLLAFLSAMGGAAGRFTWNPPLPRRGGGTSAGGLGPRIKTAGLTGTTVVTTGWAGAGVTVATGDLVGWLDPTGRPQLHMVQFEATRVGADCTFNVWPAIRRSPAADTALELVAPTAIWRLSEDANPFDFGRGLVGATTLRIEEALA